MFIVTIPDDRPDLPFAYYGPFRTEQAARYWAQERGLECYGIAPLGDATD